MPDAIGKSKSLQIYFVVTFVYQSCTSVLTLAPNSRNWILNILNENKSLFAFDLTQLQIFDYTFTVQIIFFFGKNARHVDKSSSFLSIDDKTTPSEYFKI